MNKILKSLLVAALVISSTAAAHSNKTHLQLRNQALRNLPLEQTTIKERIVAKTEDRVGGTVSVTGFYGQNTKAKELGKYFAAAADGQVTVTKKATLAPEIINYGAVLGYNQDLSKLVGGLSLKVIVPVENASTDLKFKAVTAGEEADLAAAVTAAKLGKKSTTGVADIDVQIGYKFLDKETYNASINIGGVIPTGKELKAVTPFEPQVGSNHFGLGAGLDAQARVWGKADHNVKLNFAANYRYMFQATEKRKVGKGTQLASFMHADTLPIDVKVTPGSKLDGILGLAYNNGGLTADLGYNAYFAQEESVTLKTVVAPVVSDAKTATTPAQFTNGAYAGIGYAFKNWEYPVTFGLGGKYEFASKNSVPNFWQAWAKTGLSF